MESQKPRKNTEIIVPETESYNVDLNNKTTKQPTKVTRKEELSNGSWLFGSMNIKKDLLHTPPKHSRLPDVKFGTRLMIAAEAEELNGKCYEFYEAIVNKISSVGGVVVNIKFTVDNAVWSNIPLDSRKECTDFTRREFKAVNEHLWGIHADEPHTFIGGKIGGSNTNDISLSPADLRNRAAKAAEHRLKQTSSSVIEENHRLILKKPKRKKHSETVQKDKEKKKRRKLAKAKRRSQNDSKFVNFEACSDVKSSGEIDGYDYNDGFLVPDDEAEERYILTFDDENQFEKKRADAAEDEVYILRNCLKIFKREFKDMSKKKDLWKSRAKRRAKRLKLNNL